VITKTFHIPHRSSGIIKLLVGLGLMTLTFALQPGTAQAAKTLYISPSGSDSGNSCQSAANPCKTANYAIGKMGDGDTLEVGAGTYTNTASVNCPAIGSHVINIVIDTKNCPSGCTIEAQSGSGTVNIRNDSSGVGICIDNSSGWTIKNLNFSNTKQAGRIHKSNNTVLQDLNFDYTDTTQAATMFVDASDSITLTRTNMINTVGCNAPTDGDYVLYSLNSTNLTVEESTLAYDDHIAMIKGTSGMTFRRNRVKMFRAHGFQIEQGSSNILVENNIFEDDPICKGITTFVGPRIIDVYEVDGLTVRNNTVVGHGWAWQHWWYFTYGLKEQASAGCTNSICDRARIRSYNNLVYDLMPLAERWVNMSYGDYTTQTDIAMDGNLYYGGAETWTEWLGCGGNLTWSQWKGCSGWDGTNNMDPHSYNIAPSFSDYAGGDYRAKSSTSPQVDAGQSGVDSLGVSRCASVDFNGTPRTDGKCDIGAFEFGEGVSSDTTPPVIPTGLIAK
jgi:hypothetical protein